MPTGALVMQVPCAHMYSANHFLIGFRSASQDGAHTLHHRVKPVFDGSYIGAHFTEDNNEHKDPELAKV